MSLLRTGIVIACGAAVWPTDPAQREHIIAQAGEAAAWVQTFCEREPGKCEQASQAWANVTDRAILAARVTLQAYQNYAVSENIDRFPVLAFADTASQSQGDSPAAHALAAAKPAASRARTPALPLIDTLTREDIAPAWRGTRAGRGAI